VGLLLSLIGLLFDKNKKAAVIGILLSGLLVLFFCWSSLC
jgi:hypothetical protein